MRDRLAALAVVVAVALGGGIQGVAAAAETVHTIVMDGTAFQPPALTVNMGDKVVWVNKDPFPHTATASGVFDSDRIAAGAKWIYTARKRGDFAYVCTLHPTMKGRLIVK